MTTDAQTMTLKVTWVEIVVFCKIRIQWIQQMYHNYGEFEGEKLRSKTIYEMIKTRFTC